MLRSPSPVTQRLGPLLLTTMLVLATASPPPLPQASPWAGIRTAIQKAMIATSTPGASVIVVSRSRVLYEEAFGVADPFRNTSTTLDSVFQMASISKSMAAYAAMRLVEQGKIGLDEPVEPYLTRWRFPRSPRVNATLSGMVDGITLRRLLTHTAGLGLGGFAGSFSLAPTLEEALDAQKVGCCLSPGSWAPGNGDTKLVHEPGTRFSYSGGGTTVVELLIEELSGVSFSDYVESEILPAFGMADSGYTFDPAGAHALGRCNPNERGSEYCEGLTGPDLHFALPNIFFSNKGAAGLFSTARDMGRWMRSVLDRSGPVSRATMEQMFALWPESTMPPLPPFVGADGTGLGYFVEKGIHGSLVGHSGSNLGYRLNHVVHLGLGVGIAVLTNGDQGMPVFYDAINEWRGSIGERRLPPLPDRSFAL